MWDGIRRTFGDQTLDALVTPTIPMPTLPVYMLSVDLTGSGETALLAFLHHTFLANVAGIPALTVPCWFSDESLPIGLQLYGRPLRRADDLPHRSRVRVCDGLPPRRPESAASPPDVRTPRSA